MISQDIRSHERFGAPILQRISEIKTKVADCKRFHGIEFQGKYQDIPVITVRIDFPVYRLANGRTRSFQREYLALNPDAPADLFKCDHDSFAAQSAQHDILYKLVEEEDLLKAFKSEYMQQTEPIVCTSEGVVVNGNRRLCAWRSLYYSDQNRYKHFQTISIAILPLCDERDIEELEKRLQIQNPMRAEYHWHAIALMAKEDIQNGKRDGDVAKSYGKSTQALHLLMDARDYAEQYLISIGKTDQWSLVDKDYYAFEQMVKGRKKLQTQGEKELFESLAFSFITSGSKEGRLYELIPDIADNLAHIEQELAQKMLTEGQTGHEDSNIDLLAGDEPIKVERASQVAAAIKENDDAVAIQKTTRTVIEVQKQLKHEKHAENYLLLQLSKAVSALQNAIDNGISDRKVNIDGVKKQLETIDEKVDYIREWLDQQ